MSTRDELAQYMCEFIYAFSLSSAVTMQGSMMLVEGRKLLTKEDWNAWALSKPEDSWERMLAWDAGLSDVPHTKTGVEKVR